MFPADEMENESVAQSPMAPPLVDTAVVAARVVAVPTAGEAISKVCLKS